MLVNLKAALAARELRQADLAADLKISPSALSEIVNGRRKPEPHVAARISEILQADQTWLFSGRCVVPPLVVNNGESAATPAMACAGVER